MRARQKDRENRKEDVRKEDRAYITIVLTTGEKVTGKIEKMSFVSEADGLFKVLAMWEHWKDLITINYDHVIIVRDATKEEIAGAKLHGY